MHYLKVFFLISPTNGEGVNFDACERIIRRWIPNWSFIVLYRVLLDVLLFLYSFIFFIHLSC